MPCLFDARDGMGSFARGIGGERCDFRGKNKAIVGLAFVGHGHTFHDCNCEIFFDTVSHTRPRYSTEFSSFIAGRALVCN